jgi:acyl-CoA thioesterase
MGQPPTASITDKLAFKELGPNTWETIHFPGRMGNSANIAYGGYAVAVAVQAAYKVVSDGYFLYTIMGNFLGPALTDRPLRASTKVLRSTRTFTTCQVEVSQKTDDDRTRLCLVALADFQVQEQGDLLVYSKPPSRQYSHWKDCLPREELAEKMLVDGKISRQIHDGFLSGFAV